MENGQIQQRLIHPKAGKNYFCRNGMKSKQIKGSREEKKFDPRIVCLLAFLKI